MRTIWRIAVIATLGLALAASADEGDRAKHPKSDAGSAKVRGQEKAQADAHGARSPRKEPYVVYVPPPRGSTRARTGGGTRGPGRQPILAALVPDHVGVTNRAQPSLAWYVSEATDERVDFTLVDPAAVEPVLETTLTGPFTAGIHLVRLAEHGVRLEEGRSYDWSVALVPDPENRDRDVVAGGAIRREPAAPGVASEIAAGEPSYRVLARAGVWYDAIADLSEAIAARPDEKVLREERAALLEQVGVGAAASFDRESHGGDEAME